MLSSCSHSCWIVRFILTLTSHLVQDKIREQTEADRLVAAELRALKRADKAEAVQRLRKIQEYQTEHAKDKLQVWCSRNLFNSD